MKGIHMGPETQLFCCFRFEGLRWVGWGDLDPRGG